MIERLLILAVISAQPRPAILPDTTPPAVADTSTVVSRARPIDPVVLDDTIPRRRRAVQHSDEYYTRLAIHRIASYAILPLFAAEFALGQNLLNDSRPPTWIKPTHVTVAVGIGALFTTNTVTGVWNLWDSRHDEAGRTRRIVHTALMLTSDAGFVWASAISNGHSLDAERRHRNVALGSIAVSSVGTAIMWLWRN
jgi:hypothetical protein